MASWLVPSGPREVTTQSGVPRSSHCTKPRGSAHGRSAAATITSGSEPTDSSLRLATSTSWVSTLPSRSSDSSGPTVSTRPPPSGVWRVSTTVRSIATSSSS
ncbi:MAG: hypothetical protein R3F59_22585 [Myxococcota bacterium]